MTQTIQRPQRPDYTEAVRQRALVEVAACAGNTRMASRRLAEFENWAIPQETLATWKTKLHAAEYQRIRSEQLPVLREQAADAHATQEELDLALSQAATERLLIELPHMKLKDVIDAKAKADIGSGIHAEKRLLYDGQPTVRVARGSAEVLRDLKSLGMDEIDVQVISEEDVKETPESHIAQHSDDPPKPSDRRI